MSTNLSDWIPALEAQWDEPNGFLWKAREGNFDPQQGLEFLKLLESLPEPDGAMIDRRVVALLWYLPYVLEWQKERVAEKGGDSVRYERLSNQVHGVIERILGAP